MKGRSRRTSHRFVEVLPAPASDLAARRLLREPAVGHCPKVQPRAVGREAMAASRAPSLERSRRSRRCKRETFPERSAVGVHTVARLKRDMAPTRRPFSPARANASHGLGMPKLATPSYDAAAPNKIARSSLPRSRPEPRCIAASRAPSARQPTLSRTREFTCNTTSGRRCPLRPDVGRLPAPQQLLSFLPHHMLTPRGAAQ